MKVNLSIPNSMQVAAMLQPWEVGLGSEEIGRVLELADRLGFYKAMVAEHFIIPEEHAPLSGDHYFHAATALAFVAGRTRRLRLTSAVSILPLQNPIIQAKIWATLDFLSGGRAAPIFGVGWLEAEYEMLGVPFHERGRLADEYIAAMIELWTSDSPRFDGRYVKFENVRSRPRPVQQPHPPIWFGGDATGVLRRVARFGDGWSPQRLRPEDFPSRIDFIRSQPEYDGRPLDIFFALSMLGVGSRHEILNEPLSVGKWAAQPTIDQCAWLAKNGVTEVVLPLPQLSGFEQFLEWIHWAAEEIIPHVEGIAPAR